MTATPPQSDMAAPYPKAFTAWVMVILLTFAYILSFVDRFILGLLVEPIKADLQLTDTQIGLLLGPAFAIFYATMGLPFGWLADRKRRTWIVAGGVFLWSAATAASGMAKSFLPMFLARMGVGVGEATLSPCAMSMIADSFPKHRRGKPIAVYSTAMSLGAALAAFVGAGVLAWAKTVPSIELPVMGAIAPWQFVFLIVSVPGLILALPLFMLPEPKRRGVIGVADGEAASFGDMLRYVRARWRTFGGFMLIFTTMTTVAYSHQWMPSTFKRTWNWEPETYALVNAVILLAIAPITINISGWLSDKMTALGRGDTPLLIPIIGLFIIIPTAAIAPLMPSGEWAFVMLAFTTVGLALVSATGVTALLNIAPGEMRGQIIALYYMCMSMGGLLLGPTSVGLLADYVFGAENLRYAVALPALIFGLPVLALTPKILRMYSKERLQVETAEAEAAAAAAPPATQPAY